MVLARATAALSALIVCAWFAVGIRQAHDASNVAAALANGESLRAPQAAHLQSLLRAAGTLNPDTQVDLLRGQILMREQQRARALRIFEDVTRREPTNLEAWVLVAQTAYGNGPVIDRALERIGQLDHVGASTRR